MKHECWVIFSATILSIALARSASANCTNDPTTSTNCATNASRYLVRTDCGTAPNELPNCFESMADLSGVWTSAVSNPEFDPGTGNTNCPTGASCVTGFLWKTPGPAPSETNPVIVDIGPGTFDPFICPKNTASGGGLFGHVIVRGAGRDETFLKPGATAATTSGRIGIHVNDCDELVFSELHAEGAQAGVQWWNGGEATWTRVDMVATGNPAGGRDFTAGWFDSSDDLATTRSTHFLHDCRSSVSSNATPLRSQEAGYYTQAAETYFFGGVISAGPSIKPAKQNTVGVYVYNNSTFSAFDTQIVAKRESAGAFLISTDGVNVQAGSQGGARAFLQGVSILVRAPEPRNGVKVPGSGEVIQVDTTVDVAEQD